jgi:hypothetical protein
MNQLIALTDVEETGGILWKADVDPEDYDAAFLYLSILLDRKRALAAVEALKKEKVVTRRANDVLRGCRREPLPLTDIGVKASTEGVRAGKKLSPILVVSFSHGGDIADGYHRVSVVYNIDPFADVKCKIAHVPHLHG